MNSEQNKPIEQWGSKTLIAVVCYEAERHIFSVLNRIPKEIWNHPDFHVLISDDGSKDNTTEVAKQHLSSFGENYSIQRIVLNQGYGGNQKLCYQFAIKHGFDLVVMLHGDGQYAPELLLEFVKIHQASRADVILGSRMISWKSARKGGMPWYKLIGNIVLTKTQNLLCNTQLSEFHTGYRAYSVNLLKSINFMLNSDEFHFDTEILLQAFHTNAKIKEFLIPTHYGDEVCRVPGLYYAKKVVIASLKYKLQKIGLFNSIKYLNSSKSYYNNNFTEINSAINFSLSKLKALANGNQLKVLDLNHRIFDWKERLQAVQQRDTSQDNTHSNIQIAHLVDSQTQELAELKQYDVIMLLDMQLVPNIEELLINLKANIDPEDPQILILSTTNIGFFLARLNLLLGRFSYSDRGLINKNYHRYFTYLSIQTLLKDLQFNDAKWTGLGVPFSTLFKGRCAAILGKFSAKLAQWLPSWFAFEFVVIINPKSTKVLLEHDLEHLPGS